MATPNIVYILADDMGYGDLHANNPASRIPTPHLDRLAAQGMRFADSHAGSSVCTPSRYAVLTGRYAWRSRLKHGIVWEWDGPLLEPDRLTVAALLQQHGYSTACFGKWHLGWDWPTRNGEHPNETLPFGRWGGDVPRAPYEENIDHSGRLGGGPVDRGFDHYFGVDVPNFPPYTWFENDRLLEIPTQPKPDDMYGHPGLAVPDWSLERMIPEFTRRCVRYIEERAQADEPFFVYYPLTSPHSPIVPNEPFKGRSGAGNYGDFVYEVDWVVGEIMDALERAEVADDTLLIFTSDNGPESRTPDDIGAYSRVREYGHYSMGQLRGIKLDAWEGGHRTPFVARWPNVVPAGTACSQLTCMTDFMATCADILEEELQGDAGEDSVSMLPLLNGRIDEPTRESAVHHSGSGKFAVRRGDWVFIDAPKGNDKEEPGWFRERRGYTDHDYPGELYDLSDDISERRNLYGDRPDIVERLATELGEVKAGHGGPDPAPEEKLTE
ncbi:MAG: arylsulfatase [Candidatus Brocadiaceae bacterium]|jgi:arylsulfatase A-like enzyme